MKNQTKKRVDVVSIKLCREASFLYEPRQISTPNHCVDLLRQFLDDIDREELIVIALDTKNQPLTVNVCSRGSLNNSIVHPREIFKTAILSNAAAIIIGHNHPSGHTNPSQDDVNITNRLIEAGKILGIPLLDHLILGKGGDFASLKEMGHIKDY